MKKYAGTYVGTVERLPNGQIGVRALPKLTNNGPEGLPSFHPFGRWMECDIGKQVFRVGSVLQMENDEQMKRRLGA